MGAFAVDLFFTILKTVSTLYMWTISGLQIVLRLLVL